MKEQFGTLVKTTYELTAVSPIHIGNGDVFKNYEYIYDKTNEKVYFIDESKWIKFLASRNLTDEFVTYLLSAAKSMGGKRNFKGEYLWDWLKRKGATSAMFKNLANRVSNATNNALAGDKNTLNDVACQIALANGSPYIPGSSLKGALRTGILYRLIMKNPDIKEKYWYKIKNVPMDKYAKRNLAKIIAELEKEALSRLNNPIAEQKGKKIDAQVKSVMRGVSISDAMPVSKMETVIVKKIDVSTKKNKSGKYEKILPLSRECIAPKSKFRFSVTIDAAMLKEIGFKDTNEILTATREFFLMGLAMQEKVFGKATEFGKSYAPDFAEAKDADFAIGGGTGFLTKTLCYSLAPTEKEGRDFVRKFLSASFKNHKHDTFDNRLSPRTLKVTRMPGERFIMGLAQVNEVK